MRGFAICVPWLNKLEIIKCVLPLLLGLPRWLSSKESACQCKRCGFHPWVGKIPGRRKWQPKSHEQRGLADHWPLGCRVRQDLAVKRREPLLLPSLCHCCPTSTPATTCCYLRHHCLHPSHTMTKISNRELSLDSLAKHCCKCFACIYSLDSYENSEEVFKYH